MLETTARPALGAALGLILLAVTGAGCAPAGEEARAAEPASEPVAAGTTPSPVPDEWRTVAEKSGFRATSSYAETLAFLEQVAATSDAVHLTHFGLSPQGREMPLVVVSEEGAFTPEAAQRLARDEGKPIVLIQNGIHSGEIDGKDACLLILRDLALGGHRDLLDAATLLIVPIYNVDGHERVSPYNRANQDGPAEGMGFRTTANGLDLNRDHLKAVAPETRAVLDLFDRWRPHLHVDDHVTDGSDHGWVLTWAWTEAPQLQAAPAAWMAEHMPRALSATEARGHAAGPYPSLLDRSDPSQGIASWVGQPRYATGYYPLRNRPAVLVEMHSYKPYEQRVRANHDFLVELLREVGRGGAELVEAVATAERQTAALGAPDAEPSEAVLTWRPGGEPDRVLLPFHAWYREESKALGEPILRYGEDLRPTEVTWLHRPVPVTTVPRPRGYLVLPGWPQIEERIAAHGLTAHRLTAPAELEVEAIRVSEPELAAEPYQGTHRIDSVEVARPAERRTFPAGTTWIPADQPGFEVAVQLLEPEAQDSLFAWGLLSTVTERKEYIEPRVLEPMVREMLEEPEVRAEWNAALEADPELAGDRWERWLWWYRRTPYWDDTVGLMPVFRVMHGPEIDTGPWRPVAAGPDPAYAR